MKLQYIQPQYIIIGVFIILKSAAFSAGWVSDGLYGSTYDESLYEINKIKFSGNENFPDDELRSIIRSREINKGLIFKTLEGLYFETEKNKYTPEPITKSLANAVEPFKSDLTFFSEKYVIEDSISLFNFYNKRGFHNVEITKKFYPDSSEKINILEFRIDEGKRYKVENFRLKGIDSLDRSFKKDIVSKKILEKGDYFNEEEVYTTGKEIRKYFRNNGWRFAEYSFDRVVMDRESLTDSITLNISPGIRLYFGKVEFIHIKFDNKKISDKLLFKMLTWEEGDLYRYSKIEQVQKNLFDLGVFNSVKINTKKIDTLDQKIDFQIIVEYREQRTYNASAGFNRTDDNFTNISGNLEFTHQNIFGGAQVFTPKMSIIYRDINDLNNSRANTGRSYIFSWGDGGLPQPDEYNIGFNYLEHSLTTIGDARILLEVKPLFSLRRIFNDFNIRRVSIPFNFPVRFKTQMDFSQLSFKFLLESEKTLNFESVSNMDGDDLDEVVLQRLLEANITYQKLYDYGLTHGNFPITTIQFGFSATKDERNNNFYPSEGYLIDFQLEGNSPTWTLAQYIRTLFDALYFKELDQRLVFGAKLKGGYIWFYDRNNTYVPLDRQFYSGGANSVRGWAARKLRFTESYDNSLIQTGQVGFLENYVGGTTMMEFSLELRYDLMQPNNVNDILASVIGSSSLSMFLDGGNSFNWLIDDNFTENFSFGRFAYSIGAGYGYRTPLGPLRIDYAIPIYGPVTDPQNLSEYQTFGNPSLRLNDPGWLFTGSFHIALGYSF